MSEQSSNDDVRGGELPDEELVAYLDGELDVEASRRIEAQLAADARIRERLQKLQRTWDLLGELDEALVDDTFTRSTLEMVALKATEESSEEPGRPWRRWAGRGGKRGNGLCGRVLDGGALVAQSKSPAAGGSAGVAEPRFVSAGGRHPVLTPVVQRALVRPGRCRQGRVEAMSGHRSWKIVLLMLAVLAGTGWSGDSSSEKRRRIEAMTPGEREELRRRHERFASLDPAEQERLRRLHRELEADPEAEHLREVMDHYHQWLMTLSLYHRAELQQLDPSERVKRVKSMLEEQAQREAKRLGVQDLATLTGWMERYALQHEARFLDMVPENQRQNYQKAAPAMRPRMLFAMVWWRWQRWGMPKMPGLTEEELADLKSVLSPEARAHVDGKPPGEQRQIVTGWIRQAVQQHLASLDLKSQPGMSDEELAKFFEKDLSDQQRGHLLSLPNEEMQRELRQLYTMAKRGGDMHNRGDRPKKKTGLENPLKVKKPRAKEKETAPANQ